MASTTVKSHPRKLPSGEKTTVRQHPRSIPSRLKNTVVTAPTKSFEIPEDDEFDILVKKSRSFKSQPVKSSKAAIARSLRSAKDIVEKGLPEDVNNTIIGYNNLYADGFDSKHFNTKDGIYTAERKKVHAKILKKFLSQDKSSNDPDVYVFGGVAGSGKSTVLSGFVPENALVINNDDIKQELAKYDPSPLKGYPLIHATYLHEESSDIESELLAEAIRQKKDIILDRTLASADKNKSLLKKMHNKGYRVTVLGTNLPPHLALMRVSTRFIRKGRYVPFEYVAAKGNQTNRSVLDVADEEFVDSAKVFDTTKSKPKLIFSK